MEFLTFDVTPLLIFISGVITALVICGTYFYFHIKSFGVYTISKKTPLPEITSESPSDPQVRRSENRLVPSEISVKDKSDPKTSSKTDTSDEINYLLASMSTPMSSVSPSQVLPASDINKSRPMSSPGRGVGSYVLMDNVVKLSDNERALIYKYDSVLKNKSYSDAVEIAKTDGFELHVLYNGYTSDVSKKMARLSYSPTIIGVRIKDQYYDNKSSTPSDQATVVEVIDIGGVDVHNFGLIRL